jgi:hypothetical protein
MNTNVFYDLLMSTDGVFYIIVVLSCLGGLFAPWWLVLRRPQTGAMPGCRRCGYTIYGSDNPECPECGANLIEVGVTVPAIRHPPLIPMFVLIWSVCLPIPLLIVSGILVWYGPKTAIPTPWLELTPIQSGQYESVVISTEGAPPLTELDINFTGLSDPSGFYGKPYVAIIVEFPAMTYHSYYWSDDLTKPAPGVVPYGLPNIPFDKSAILDLLDCVGADISRKDVQDEADELLKIVRLCQIQGVAGHAPTLYTPNYVYNSYNFPAKWFLILQPVLWFIIWLAGIIQYRRMRRIWQDRFNAIAPAWD